MDKITLKVEFWLATQEGEATKSRVSAVKSAKPLSSEGQRLRGALLVALGQACAGIFGDPSEATMTATLEA